MRRRKKYGYILLTMLIVSGLAGTPTDNSLTKKERTLAVDLMKNTRSHLMNTLKSWSDDQLNYRSAPGKWSVTDCVYHIAATEKTLWQLLETTMQGPPNAEKRAEINRTDEQVINTIQDKCFLADTPESFESKNTVYKSFEAALSDFKVIRGIQIKYIRNSTEDLRNHVAETAVGWLDCYQLALMISAHSSRHIQQINEIKAQPGFPK